jgi:hypothetical protein
MLQTDGDLLTEPGNGEIRVIDESDAGGPLLLAVVYRDDSLAAGWPVDPDERWFTTPDQAPEAWKEIVKDARHIYPVGDYIEVPR